MDRVEITIKSGVVVEVNSPAGIDVAVYDYDTEGMAKQELEYDKEGKAYSLAVYHNEND